MKLGIVYSFWQATVTRPTVQQLLFSLQNESKASITVSKIQQGRWFAVRSCGQYAQLCNIFHLQHVTRAQGLTYMVQSYCTQCMKPSHCTYFAILIWNIDKKQEIFKGLRPLEPHKWFHPLILRQALDQHQFASKLIVLVRCTNLEDFQLCLQEIKQVFQTLPGGWQSLIKFGVSSKTFRTDLSATVKHTMYDQYDCKHPMTCSLALCNAEVCTVSSMVGLNFMQLLVA